MKKLKTILPVLLITAALSLGGLLIWHNNNHPAVETQPQTEVKDQSTINYEGQEGKTALELLKQKAEVVTKKDPSLGEYVVSINGKDGNGKKYWLYYINGEAAKVGAGSYNTKKGEKIEWRLE